MPPEQFGGQTTPGSDLYALGATIICLATGQHPSELPHLDMRIDFVDRVNLTPRLVDWLKWMTATSIDSRLQSALDSSAALNDRHCYQKNSVITAKKPFGSKIKIRTSEKILEVVIPPRGFHIGLISLIPVALFFNLVAFTYCLPLLIFAQTAWMFLCLLLFTLPFLVAGIWTLWLIIFELAGQRRLVINQFEISLSLVVCGLKFSPFLTAPRKYITQVEHVSSSYKGYQEETIYIPSQLNIWAGIKKFELGGKADLTTPEREWLAFELTQWLDLPTPLDLQKQKRERRKFPPLSHINSSSNKLEP
jgi:hypothetical protein